MRVDSEIGPLHLEALRRAVQRTRKLKPLGGYYDDDVRQDALFAIWRASKVISTDLEKAHYIATLALAGYRGVLDARIMHYRDSKIGGQMPVYIDAMLPGEEDVLHVDDPASTPEAQFAYKQLVEAVNLLAAKHQQVMEMTIEGDTAPEIAEKLGISENQAVWLRRNALEHLVKIINKRENFRVALPQSAL